MKLSNAVFFDRDGVINRAIIRGGRPCSPRSFDEFALHGGIEKGLNELKKMGFLNIVFTNQPDIARGLLSREDLEAMHEFLRTNLPVDDIYVCMHDERDSCVCRKPKPGMLLSASLKWNINLKRSFVIGDTWKDIEAGKRAGCLTVLIEAPYNRDVEPDFRASGLYRPHSLSQGAVAHRKTETWTRGEWAVDIIAKTMC